MITVKQELEMAREAGLKMTAVAEEAGLSSETMTRILNGADVAESTALAVRAAIRRIVERLDGALTNG